MKRYRGADSCRAHCCRCNRHFASQKAFDAHIVQLKDGGSVHIRPRDSKHLRPRTRDGLCSLSSGFPGADENGRKEGVTLWEHAGDADRAETRFGKRKKR